MRLDYWKVIEEYVRNRGDWVDFDDIIKETGVPRWIVEQWFKKVALNNEKFEVKMVFFGNWKRMVRLNGR